jgi:hypothetical protein
MAGLLIDKLYCPSEVVISDMESHMAHIQHNIGLNSGIRSLGSPFSSVAFVLN